MENANITSEDISSLMRYISKKGYYGAGKSIKAKIIIENALSDYLKKVSEEEEILNKNKSLYLGKVLPENYYNNGKIAVIQCIDIRPLDIRYEAGEELKPYKLFLCDADGPTIGSRSIRPVYDMETKVCVGFYYFNRFKIDHIIPMDPLNFSE